MSVYEACPVYENETVLLRPVTADDAQALLSCYGDEHAFFNDDNCHGDDFRYRTQERMREAIRFWQESYEQRFFVRWAIVDQSLGVPVGTVEMFRREAEDADDGAGVLRLDLMSRFETRSYVGSVLELCLKHFFEDFGVERIVTKAPLAAYERRKALEFFGFRPVENGFAGFPLYFDINR